MTIQEWAEGKPLKTPILCPIELLVPVDYNPRKIEEEGLQALKRSLMEDPGYQEINPIKVNINPERMGFVYAGNQRVVALKDLGFSEAWVTLDNISEEVERARAIKDNIHQGEWVQEQLKLNLETMHGMNINMAGIGFTPTQLSTYMTGMTLTDPKNDPENTGTTPRKSPKLKIAEGAELECPNCHSKFTYGIKADLTGNEGSI